jgi:hypothetical protein
MKIIRQLCRRISQPRTTDFPKVYNLKVTRPRIKLSDSFFISCKQQDDLGAVVNDLCQINDVGALKEMTEKTSSEVLTAVVLENIPLIMRSNECLMFIIGYFVKTLNNDSIGNSLKVKILETLLNDSFIANKLFSSFEIIDGLSFLAENQPSIFKDYYAYVTDSHFIDRLEVNSLFKLAYFVVMLNKPNSNTIFPLSYIDLMFRERDLELLLVDKNGVKTINDICSIIIMLRKQSHITYGLSNLLKMIQQLTDKITNNIEILSKNKNNLQARYFNLIYKMCIIFPEKRNAISKAHLTTLFESINEPSFFHYGQIGYMMNSKISIEERVFGKYVSKNFDEFVCSIQFFDFDFLNSRKISFFDIFARNKRNILELSIYMLTNEIKVMKRSLYEIAYRTFFAEYKRHVNSNRTENKNTKELCYRMMKCIEIDRLPFLVETKTMEFMSPEDKVKYLISVL